MTPATTQLLKKAFADIDMNLDVDAVLGDSRRSDHVMMRRVACQVLRNSGYTLTKIGRELNRHHATVLHFLKNEGWEPMPEISLERDDKLAIKMRINYHKDQIAKLKEKL